MKYQILSLCEFLRSDAINVERFFLEIRKLMEEYGPTSSERMDKRP